MVEGPEGPVDTRDQKGLHSKQETEAEGGFRSGLNPPTACLPPLFFSEVWGALLLPLPPREPGLLNPTQWVYHDGSLLAGRHHPNFPREAPVTSLPRAPTDTARSLRWDAQHLWHLEPDCEREGPPLREPRPRPGTSGCGG